MPLDFLWKVCEMENGPIKTADGNGSRCNESLDIHVNFAHKIEKKRDACMIFIIFR